MAVCDVQLLKDNLSIEPHKRKPSNHSYITSFLKSTQFFRQMLESEGFSNSSQYIDILSYYLKYAQYPQGEELTKKFEEHSFVYVLTGSLRRIEYEQDPETIRKLFEEKINYHRDKMYWKKELVLLWTQQIRLFSAGSVHLTEGAHERLLVDASSPKCEILYITAQKLKDAEILRNKSMRNQTNFLKSTIFWKKCDIEELKKIVIRCSHRLYSQGESVYREEEPIQYVYVVREGEFLYEKAVEIEDSFHMRQKAVKISKLVQGEVIGYNELLQSITLRQYSLRCNSEFGELYLLPMDYWQQLYSKFSKEFNQLHEKCLHFRERQISRRVLSLQENPQLALGRRRKLPTEELSIDLGHRSTKGSRINSKADQPSEIQPSRSLPLVKPYRSSVKTPRRLKPFVEALSPSFFIEQSSKLPVLKAVARKKQVEHEASGFNSLYMLKCKQRQFELHRQRLMHMNLDQSLLVYQSRNKKLLRLQQEAKKNNSHRSIGT